MLNVFKTLLYPQIPKSVIWRSELVVHGAEVVTRSNIIRRNIIHNYALLFKKFVCIEKG